MLLCYFLTITIIVVHWTYNLKINVCKLSKKDDDYISDTTNFLTTKQIHLLCIADCIFDKQNLDRIFWLFVIAICHMQDKIKTSRVVKSAFITEIYESPVGPFKLHEFTISTSRIQLREFTISTSWIHDFNFTNSWSWNRAFLKLKSWILEVEIENLWSWTREFMKLKRPHRSFVEIWTS
jgi:hypothetical protein